MRYHIPLPGHGKACAMVIAMAMATGAALIAAGCGGGSPPVDAATQPVQPVQPVSATPPPGDGPPSPNGAGAGPALPSFQLKVLSSKPEYVSGGDALVEVTVPDGVSADRVAFNLNGSDISPQAVASTDPRKLTRLVSGLTTDRDSSTGSPNILKVRHLDQAAQSAQITLTNYPITGPMLSGPQIQPYECRTLESGLGVQLDSSCSARTRFDWFYFTKPNGSASGKFVPFDPKSTTMPADLAETTTTDNRKVPFIVRVESGTINRGIYRLAVLADPSTNESLTLVPGSGWNKKLAVYFDVSTSASYNQGTRTMADAIPIGVGDLFLSRGYAFLSSSELWNQQHSNPHLQGETLMMLKEHAIKSFGAVPRWTVGLGGSGGAIQQHLIAQLFPGLLDGIQPLLSFPETLMPEVAECRLLETAQRTRQGAFNWLTWKPTMEYGSTWTPAKLTAVDGFNSAVCVAWSGSYANIFDSSNQASCAGTNVAAAGNYPNAFNALTNPAGVRCDIFQTNKNLLGTVGDKARRPFDNVGIQYGLNALTSGTISIAEFLDLNERIGGLDGDGLPQAQRSSANMDAVRLAYRGGLRNSFSGAGIAGIPIITQRSNAGLTNDIHDPLQDLIVRERIKAANGGRADNQIIWTSFSSSPLDIFAMIKESLGVMEPWLDAIADDPAPPSMEKVNRLKPPRATDACWDTSGNRFEEVASVDPAARCNKLYPRASTPRLAAGARLGNNVLKCQLKPFDPNDPDYSAGTATVRFSSDDQARMNKIFPTGVCDWSKKGDGELPLDGTYLRLPLPDKP